MHDAQVHPGSTESRATVASPRWTTLMSVFSGVRLSSGRSMLLVWMLAIGSSPSHRTCGRLSLDRLLPRGQLDRNALRRATCPAPANVLAAAPGVNGSRAVGRSGADRRRG